MLVLGTECVAKPFDRGTFFCPFCLTEAPYKLNKVRLFFTIYYVPVMPLREEGTHVECARCLETFEASVLERPSESDQFPPIFKRTMVRMLAIMATVDGTVHPDERLVISQLYEKLFGVGLGARELDALLEDSDFDLHGAGIASFLRASRPLLNTSGREKILIAALQVASADKQILGCEENFLWTLGHSLGLNDVHIRDVVKDFDQLGLKSALLPKYRGN
jgi:uncharacterized tellurite resistance protein B-like protein